jgi:hypothetical protein
MVPAAGRQSVSPFVVRLFGCSIVKLFLFPFCATPDFTTYPFYASVSAVR